MKAAILAFAPLAAAQSNTFNPFQQGPQQSLWQNNRNNGPWNNNNRNNGPWNNNGNNGPWNNNNGNNGPWNNNNRNNGQWNNNNGNNGPWNNNGNNNNWTPNPWTRPSWGPQPNDVCMLDQYFCRQIYSFEAETCHRSNYLQNRNNNNNNNNRNNNRNTNLPSDALQAVCHVFDVAANNFCEQNWGGFGGNNWNNNNNNRNNRNNRRFQPNRRNWQAGNCQLPTRECRTADQVQSAVCGTGDFNDQQVCYIVSHITRRFCNGQRVFNNNNPFNRRNNNRRNGNNNSNWRNNRNWRNRNNNRD